MKKIFLSFVLVFCVFFPHSAFAENFESVGIYVNGKSISELGFISNDKTMVPLRALTEAMDFKVEFKEENNEIIIKKDGHATEISLIVGNKQAKIQNKTIKLDVPSFIKEKKTMVPLRFIAENFGTNVKWYGDTKVVSVGNFRPQMAVDYEYESVYYDYLEGSLLMPKGWEDEIEVKTIKSGNNFGLYIIDKKTKEVMDKEYPKGLNGVLYRFVKVKSPWNPVEAMFLLKELDGDYLILMPDTDFNFTKETLEHYSELKKKYENVLKTYSALSKNYSKSYEIISELKSNFIPKKFFDYPFALETINDSYLYSIKTFKDDDSIEVAFYIEFDKDWNLMDYFVKSYDDEKIVVEEISSVDGLKLAESFAKRILGEENPKIVHKANLFPNREEAGVVESYQDDKDGIYLVNLKLGILIAYTNLGK